MTEAQQSTAGCPRDAEGNVKLRDYHAAHWDEPIVMEMSCPGERGIFIPLAEPEVESLVGKDAAAYIPEGMRRAAAPALPEISQHQALRHYLRLSQQTLGMDLASDISEGTCTMKYSPKVHDELCRLPQMAELHPWQDDETLQGALQILYEFRDILCAVSGLDEVSLHGGGGAHAAFTNAAVVRAYHAARGDLPQRDEFITTMFSHPCDAAAPATAGFKVITLMPDEMGYPPLEQVKAAVGERTAGIMITNPEDTGIYNPHIDKIVDLVHEAGGIAYTDQANANSVLGIARARDAGFDACHFNLHKTFSSPHACAGPATGAYCCTDELAPFLPVPVVTFDGRDYHLDYDRPQSIGKVREFYGNVPVVLRALAWCLSLGPRGLREVSEIAVLNNNYLMKKLLEIKGVTMPYEEKRRLDQVRFSLQQMKEDTGIGCHEFQDRQIDFGLQSVWTSHHPFVVPEPFTPEPCETYSKEDLDYWAEATAQVCREAYEDPEFVAGAPYKQPVAKMTGLEALEEHDKWAMTWRAYKRKLLGQE
jgi:glycine dehydrogenase subunit 2